MATRSITIRYGNSALHAIPSVHYRQVFAQLVIEACLAKPFDVIAVELPACYAQTGLIEAIQEMGSQVGLVVPHERGREFPSRPRSCPPSMLPKVQEHGDDLDWWRGQDGGVKTVVAVTPCDSIIAAIRAPRLLADRWPGWRPEIALIDEPTIGVSRMPPVLESFDDYEVIQEGLEEFYSRWKGRFEEGRDDREDGLREQAMASRLAQHLLEGRSVLFVCGAAHWGRIQEALDGGSARPLMRGRALWPVMKKLAMHKIRILPEDAWCLGWLDDMPHVVGQLEEWARMQGGGKRPSNPSFDKREAIEKMILEAVAKGQEKGLPVSPRRLALMERFGRTLRASEGRMLPQLGRHLVGSGEACVDARFADLLEKTAMKYPWPVPEGSAMKRELEGAHVVPHYMVLSWLMHGDGRGRCGGSHSYCQKPEPGYVLLSIPAWTWERPYVRYDDELLHPPDLILDLPVPAGESGRRGPRREAFAWPASIPSGIRRPPPDEDELVMRLSRRARELVHRGHPRTFSRRFEGDLGSGIDWRRTVRGRARGEGHVYVRQPRYRRVSASCDGRCPIVWLFDSHVQVVSRFAGYVPDPDHSFEPGRYCSFYWVRSSRSLAQGQVTEYRLAYHVNLSRDRLPTLDRPQQEIEKAYRTLLNERPAFQRCECEPWKDPELRQFDGGDLAIASALKYATDHILLISLVDEALKEPVLQYARRRAIEIVRVNREHFAPRALARMALTYSIPSLGPLEAPYPFFCRFVPPPLS